MTKQDLRTGMVVECKNGNVYQVFKDTAGSVIGATDIFVGVHHDGWLNFSAIDNNLIVNDNDGLTIMKVYNCNAIWHLTKPYKYKTWNCVWEREEPKELTVAEIEKLLGYPVKIVKE